MLPVRGGTCTMDITTYFLQDVVYAHGQLCALQLFHCRKKVVQTLYVIFCDGEYFPVLCRLTIMRLLAKTSNV